jgi:hypothetical protein
MKKTFLLPCAALLIGLLSGFAFITNSTTNLPIKWPPGTITMSTYLGTTKNLSDGNSQTSSVWAAADVWNQKLGNEQFQMLLGAGVPADHNHINEITMASDVYGTAFPGSTTLAITTTWYAGNQRVEADIVFNTKYNWDSYRGTYKSDPIDIQRVAIHEMGHVLGLDHPDEVNPTNPVTAIMNSHASSIDTVQADDIEGAQNLYGPPGVPANDNFANATAITLPQNLLKTTVTGYNTNATLQTGEPTNASNTGGRSVWWKWTAPYDGSVTLDTRGSYFDTTLGVYTGTALASLTQVATNDDIQRGVVQASTVTFSVTANTTYFLSVDGFNSSQDNYGADSGGISLNLNYSPTGGTAPAITTQPANQTVTAGNSVTFSVTASGTAPLSYQWFLGGSAIADATGSSYTVSNAQSGNAGNYTVSITNLFGNVTSNVASLTVNPAIVTPPPSSGGGGGGGGAPSDWFLGALATLALLRWKNRRP